MPEPIEVRKVAIKHVSDASGFAGLIDDGVIEADRVVAVIGKTEGNGGVNDYTQISAELRHELRCDVCQGSGRQSASGHGKAFMKESMNGKEYGRQELGREDFTDSPYALADGAAT